MIPEGHPKFNNEKMREIDVLFKQGVYEIVPDKDVPKTANIIGGRFVLTIKNVETTVKFAGRCSSYKNILIWKITYI